jgi:adenine-specific DNA-methyltransferase
MEKIEPNDDHATSGSIVAENVAALRALFPEAFGEGGIKFDVLKQLLGGPMDEGDERYGLSWHGKKRARQIALTPSLGTLRPCPDESVDWEATKNVVIEGDNLEVLKLLRKSYAGKVKLIYIDPPYNTGKDFVYPDDFADGVGNYLRITGQVGKDGGKITSNTESSGRFHTNWLNMMYPRLKVAKELLQDDGIVCVSLDDHEANTLRCICDEVFGAESFVGALTWVTTTQPDNIGKARFGLQQNIEYVFMYSKRPRVELPDFILRTKSGAPKYPHKGKLGACRFEIIERAFEGAYARPTMRFDILGQPPRDGKQWQIGREQATELEATGRLEVVDGIVKRAVYPEDEAGDGAGYFPFWAHMEAVRTSQAGKAELTGLLGSGHGVDTVKPVSLLTELLCHLPADAMVVDFFAGSGTSGHAVMSQNATDGGTRRFVLVQLPEPLDSLNSRQQSSADFCDKLGKPRTLVEITKERLRRAGKKLKEENKLFQGDTGFRVFKLDTSNLKPWDPRPDDLPNAVTDWIENIRPGRTEEDLLHELLLKLGLDLCVPIDVRTIAGKTVHEIGAGTLIVCLDKLITRADVEPLGIGLVQWGKQLAPSGGTQFVFRDSAFVDDVAKTNLLETLLQNLPGLSRQHVRSL